MPSSVDDEEETVCLLSAQQESPGPHLPNSHPTTSGGKDATASDTEQIFYDCSDDKDSVTAASIEAVRDILSDLESEVGNKVKARLEQLDSDLEGSLVSASGGLSMSRSLPNPASVLSDEDANDENGGNDGNKENCYCSSSSLLDAPFQGAMGVSGGRKVGGATSLVVDVHLPPQKNLPSSATPSPNSASAVNPSAPPSAKPCKHSVNRFQRCYSDGSQASPKRKGKMGLLQGSQSSKMAKRRFGKFEDLQQNLDKIETINENSGATAAAPIHVAGSAKATAINPVGPSVASSSNESSFKERFRHFSESSAAFISNKLPFSQPTHNEKGGGGGGTLDLHEELFQFKYKYPHLARRIGDKMEDKSDFPVDSSHQSKPYFGPPSGFMGDSYKLRNPMGSIVKTSHEANPSEDDDEDVHDPSRSLLPVVEAGTTSLANPNVKFPYLDEADGGGKSFDLPNSPYHHHHQRPHHQRPSHSQERALLLKEVGLTRDPINQSCSSLASSTYHKPLAGIPPSTFIRDGYDSSLNGSPFRECYPPGARGERAYNGGRGSHGGGGPVGGLSTSSSTMSMPACRICQLPGMEPNNNLISPCRCLGSIRYVHNNCLLKWLEVSSRRRSGPPACELCQYQYLRQKKFVISHWRFPECSLRDKILHVFFVFCVFIMIACAAVTIICFKEGRWPYRPHHPNKYQPGELSPPELISLSCAILFFSAFFLAMYVELKAKHTVYQLVCKFFYMNHEWSVEEYDRRKDVSRRRSGEEDSHG